MEKMDMHEVDSSAEELVLQGDFEAFTPEEMFEHWTNPSLLQRWWPHCAEVSPGLGGHYKFTWPEFGWTLDGNYTEWAPGKSLGFTWHWSHEPDDPGNMKVRLTFDPIIQEESEPGKELPLGTMLTITQGPYDNSAEGQRSRQEHLEGFVHFCMRLAGLRVGKQDSVANSDNLATPNG